jgi:hypothetical protein
VIEINYCPKGKLSYKERKKKMMLCGIINQSTIKQPKQVKTIANVKPKTEN